MYKCDRLISLVLKYECYECIRLPQLGLRGPSASEPSTSRRTSLRLGCCSGDLYMGCRPKPWYPSDLKIGKWMTLPKKTIGVAGFDPLYRLRTTRINNSEFTNSGILLVTLPAFSFDFQNASKCHFEMRFPAKIPDQLESTTGHSPDTKQSCTDLVVCYSSSIAVVNRSCQAGNIQWTRCSPILPKLALFRLP